mmetsp:Transcript_27001/g.41141  ORF Transcript_27001/g.41141 Transcript_27001/m.41141 type:complete len:113 (+) Transcript_27001:150-488(+)
MPIFGILALMFARVMITNNVESLANFDVKLPVPQFFNVPLKPLTALQDFLYISECDEWYVYQMSELAEEEDREFFGFNTGVPPNFPEGQGMLSDGVLTTHCKEINKVVPYFK